MYGIGVKMIRRLENSCRGHKLIERRILNVRVNLQGSAALVEDKSVRRLRRDLGFDKNGYAPAGIFLRLRDNLRQLRIRTGIMRPGAK